MKLADYKEKDVLAALDRITGFPFLSETSADLLAALKETGLVKESKGRRLSIAQQFRVSPQSARESYRKWRLLQDAGSPEAAQKIGKILTRRRIPLRSYLGIEKLPDNQIEILTTAGNLICSADFRHIRRAQLTAGFYPGRNRTGHKLPPTGTSGPGSEDERA